MSATVSQRTADLMVCQTNELTLFLISPFTIRSDGHGLRSCGFERSHVDGETVFHIRLQQSVVGFIHLLNRDDFHLCGDIVRPTKVEHLLRLWNTADR